jgi:outer membrane protein OmpA-like peptidoglycan-associated protein
MPKLHVRADLRWLGTAGREPEGSLSHAVEFHVGAAWLFGGKPADPDGDGVIGEAEKCPDKAEDKDGFEDADGCPDLDNDKDGIPDKKDQCPDKAENKNGLLDDDGCPDADKDGDGVADSKDKCPKRKEDKDGFKDEDGCPDFDNDGDGIADNRDKCPNKAEDKDRHDDFDGCPDPDNDGDKVPDAQDRCPNEAETINGFKDQDGCADAVPRPLQIAFGGPVKGIKFDDAKAHLDTSSYGVLDGRLRLLKEYSSLRIVVVGHVQETGDPKADLALSVERAKMVAAYFINRGVSGDRVKAKGLGSAEPLAKGSGKTAKRKNERIEMHLLAE